MQSGESLERQLKKLLEDNLKSEYGIDPANAEVFHRKGYYSKERKSNIIFDVVIEVRRPGATVPCIVWIWECKDLSRPVMVGEVEKFAAKLQQIGVHGAKGYMASRMGFQEGAVEYAKSKHIGLLRLLHDGSIIRLQEADRRLTDEVVMFGLTHPQEHNLTSLCFGLSTSGVGVDLFSDLVKIEISEGSD